MKTILLIIFIFSSINVFSQWEKVEQNSEYFVAYKNSVFLLNGNFTKSYDYGANWQISNRIDEDIDFKYNQYAYIAGNDTSIIYPSLNSIIQSSTDGGRTFISHNVENINSNQFKTCAISNYQSIVNKKQNMGVVGGIHMKMFFTFNGGMTWEYNTYDFLSSYDNKGNIIYNDKKGERLLSSHFTESTLFVGGFKSLYKLIELEETGDSVFYSIKNNLPENLRELNVLDITGNNNNLFILLTDGNHVGNPETILLKSHDLGDTWKIIDTKKHQLDTIKEIQNCGDILYIIEKNHGLMMSSNLGVDWLELNNFKDDNDSDKLPKRLQFGSNFAFVYKNYNTFRAPLKDCKIVSETSSVESTSTEPKIYPNPASESITISGIGQGKVEIYNTLGQKLIEKEIFGTSTINTSTLQTGIYVIKIESGGEVVFEKVIVNK